MINGRNTNLEHERIRTLFLRGRSDFPVLVAMFSHSGPILREEAVANAMRLIRFA
jgi:hypothetical protein